VALLLAGGLALWMFTGNVVISGSETGSSERPLPIANLCEQYKSGTLKKSEASFIERTMLGFSFFCKPDEEVQISEAFAPLCLAKEEESPEFVDLTDVEKNALEQICAQENKNVALAYQLEEEQKEKGLFQVQVLDVIAQERTQTLSARGKTESNAKIAVRAETTGVVEKIHFEKGQFIEVGDLLCTIEPAARQSQLTQAEATLDQATFDYNNAKILFEKGHVTQSRIQQLRSAFDAAKAQVKNANIEINRLNIHSKTRGIVSDPSVEIGDLLSAGSACATIVQNDPILAVAQISEQNIELLQIGTKASVTLLNGMEKQGEISYISTESDPATRTFRVEVKIDNQDLSLKDGQTAQVELMLPTFKAFQIPPDALTLNEQGQIGVKTVNADDIVGFEALKIISEDGDKVWALGNQNILQIITLGQDYVISGEKIIPTPSQIEADAETKKAAITNG